MNRKKTRILIVEDDVNLGYLLEKLFTDEGYSVTRAKTGEHAMIEISRNIYSLFIVDVGLPDISGLSVIDYIRSEDLHTPVIVITDKIEQDTELVSFKKKATLFHRKPIDFKLLIIQVSNYLNANTSSSFLRIGNLKLSVADHALFSEREKIQLSRSEFSLLLMFTRAENRYFSRNDILNKIMDRNKESTHSAVDTLMSRLRRKFEILGYADVIITLHNVGYKLNDKYKVETNIS